MGGTLALAASIAQLSRIEVRGLLDARRVQTPGSLHDPLGLAIELLRPESVSRAIATVDRVGLQTLQALTQGEDSRTDPAALDALRLQGLVGRDEHTGATVPLPEVTEAIERALGAEALSSSDPTASHHPADTSRWFGEALTAVRRAAALLRVLASQPPRLSRKGAVTATAVRSLAESTHGDAASTGHLLSVLQLANLVEPMAAGRPGSSTVVLVTSERATEWLGQPYPERWLDLAWAFTQKLDPQVRRTLDLASGDLELAAGALLAHEYPLLPATARDAASDYAATAEVLGLTTHGQLSPAAVCLFAGDRAAALEVATRDLPEPVAGVYVQPDLTVVVPGPLVPADEQALSEIAETEQLGTAAVMRLTLLSLTRALQQGQSTAAIRAFLTRVSLTGIPQPLDFMLTDLNRARWPADAHMRPGDAWISDGRARATAARDAAAANPRRVTSAPTFETTRDVAAELDALADRVFEATQAASGAGDLSRKLELAIRDKSPVQVTAAAGSDERTFTLLPVALTGGRLRATDQVAGVERTLPLSAIVAVAPVPA
ncbi:helicase-associated domain-containing protein [Leucobacter sp. W1153]|uniref:helicase-associated domain-containing protein n=1 Tax=Leucobacter sp. W1153 TaxID=3439064 RepID=UPI003F314C59